MNHIKQIEKNQRFKIQVIKKNVKRIQSTPQKLPISPDKITKAQYTSLSRKKSQNKLRDHQLTFSQQLKPSAQKHIKSRSELPCQIPLSLYLLEGQYGFDSQTLNLLMQKHLNKESKIMDQFQQQQRKNFLQKKNQVEQRIRKKHFLLNPFQNYNVVKCQSITLVSSKQKNRYGIKPSKFMQKSQTSISRRKIKIANINTNKIMNFGMNPQIDLLSMKKIKYFMDFCFKVNFSNNICLNMELKDEENQKKYKAYVAWGNHSQLVKNCIKKRSWFQITDKADQEDIRLYWTPYPIKYIYQKQKDRIQLNQQCPLLNTKRTTKVQQQVLNLNQKILTGKAIHKVQNFIFPDGYIPPFTERRPPRLISNHLSNSSCIAQKKKLFRSLFQYYNTNLKLNPFSVIPVTYNVTDIHDTQFHRFLRDNESQDKKNKIWIVKPGQNTNRGEGIRLARTLDVAKILSQDDGKRKSYVIQSYIDKPLLYNGRKFDIRHFILITSVNGLIKAYWFKEGYIRTSSQLFSLQDLNNKYIHLTNDAVQQHCQSYSNHQPANKISYNQFQRYLDTLYPNRSISFQNELLPKMRRILVNLIKSTYLIIDSKQKQANFQLFGVDFMLDRDLHPWLIQINENPCLDTNCQLLSRLIPSVIENTLRLCVDPLLPPISQSFSKQKIGLNENPLKSLKFQIMFDQAEIKSKEYFETTATKNSKDRIDVVNFCTF